MQSSFLHFFLKVGMKVMKVEDDNTGGLGLVFAFANLQAWRCWGQELCWPFWGRLRVGSRVLMLCFV